MSKEIYTCDACHYTFEAETGCDQCPDCGKKRVRPADNQESKESGASKAHREVELRNCGGKTKWLPEMIWYSW